MQQINLYQPERRPVKTRQKLSAMTILQAGVLTLIALGTLYYLDYEQQQQLKQNVAQLKKQEREQQKQVDTLTKKLAEREESKQLQRKIELLTAERNQKLLIVNRLKDPSFANTAGFSPHLEGLAQQKIPDLWLTGILLEQGGTQLLLDGSALEADLVPQYLQRLSLENSYRGKRFQTLMINRPKKEPWRLDFSIGTTSELRKHKTGNKKK